MWIFKNFFQNFLIFNSRFKMYKLKVHVNSDERNERVKYQKSQRNSSRVA